MDPAAAWPPQAIEAVKNVLTTTRTYTSCLYTLLVWEFITTWRLEYVRFWKSQWTPLKVAFLACRYWTLGLVTMIMVFFNGTISAESCKSLHFLLPGFTIVLFVICNCIIGLRVYALYERQIWILALFAGLICGEVIMSAYAIAYDAPVPMPPGEHACISNSTERNLSYFWLYWLAPLIVDCIAITLIIARSFVYYSRASDSRLPIINMLLSHGILYFLVVLCANLLNVIWYRTRSPTDNQALHSPLAIVVTSVACARLCFSLKDPKNLNGSGSGSGGASRFNTVNGSGSRGSKVATYPLSTLRKNQTTASTEKPVNGESSEVLSDVHEKSFADDAGSDVEKNVPFNVISKTRKETSVGSAYRGVEVTTAVYRSTE